jgi:hypothetical protein
LNRVVIDVQVNVDISINVGGRGNRVAADLRSNDSRLGRGL